jgi:ribonuclease BN (tRNA processing enzyme)
MSVEVTFLGSGSASAPGGRRDSCIVVRDGTTTLILDCGSTALPAITGLFDPARIDAVLVTHLHGDHFGGIPALVMHQRFAGRTRDLVLAGPAALDERLHQLSVALYADYYEQPLPYTLRVVPLAGGELTIGGARIAARRVAHAPDSDPYGLRVSVGGKLIAYTGDAEWSEAIPALADGADLFITECTTWTAHWPGHLSARELATRRDELRCGRVVLTHLGPEAVAHRGELPFEAADDGMTIRLD